MISSGLDKIFNIAWTIIKLNMMFVGFTFLGGVLLGIGPSFQMMSDLLSEYNFNSKEITWKEAFSRWKANFKDGNFSFYSFIFTTSFLGYSLYLSVQIQGLIWLMIDFLLLFMILLATLLYVYSFLFESMYDLTFTEKVKLSFISLFLDFKTLLKVIIGIVAIGFITIEMKGLLLFASFSLLIVWVAASTKKLRTFIEKQLVKE